MNIQPSQTAGKNGLLESAITSALEQQPTPAIPADFASRVAARAAAVPMRRRSPRARFARSISISLGAVLLVALFVIAPHAEPSFSSLGFDIELTLIALLAALGYWLTQMPKESL